MSSVNKVEINIINIGNSVHVLLDIKNNSIKINEVEKSISDERIEEFFRIIRLWQKEYKNSKSIDLEKFNIRIFSNEYQHTIIGDGDYPDNYLELKKWIGDVNE